MDESVGKVFIAAARQRMADSFEKIEHCVLQLPESDLAWRPFERANSVSNIILHLCGNLRQWVIHAAGEQPDRRDRPLEFSDRTVIPKAKLLDRLRATVMEAYEVLAKLDPDDLPTPRRIQGFDTNKLAAIFDSVAHLQGHTQEIIYITRLRLGDKYKFQWVPKGKEQGAAE